MLKINLVNTIRFSEMCVARSSPLLNPLLLFGHCLSDKAEISTPTDSMNN